VEAANVETGALYNAASTNVGNYAIPGLPVGIYTVTAKAPGFKTYAHTRLAVAAGQILREDISLQVGSAAESVTVQSEASLLKTESGELSHNVTSERMDNLPVLGIGSTAGSNGLRNPYAAMQLLPGSDFRPDNSIRDVWTGPTEHHFEFTIPSQRQEFDRIAKGHGPIGAK